MEGYFRQDLDVSSFIGKLGEHGRHLRSAVIRTENADPNALERAGEGPLFCSTSTALIPHPAVIWDVNRYYRMLGIGFPYRVSGREIQRAATEAKVWDNPRATYGLKVLLGKFGDWERFSYDSHFLGEEYIDPFVGEQYKALAHDASAKLAAEGIQMSPEEIAEELGFGAFDDKKALELRKAAAEARLSEVSGSPFPWSFVLQGQVAHVDLDALSVWQTELITANNALAREEGHRGLEGLAVGISGVQDGEWNVLDFEGGVIFMLGAGVLPTPTIALEAAWWALHRTDESEIP